VGKSGRGDEGFDHPVALGLLAADIRSVDGHFGLAVIYDRVEDAFDIGNAQPHFRDLQFGHHLENFSGREERSVLDHHRTTLNSNDKIGLLKSKIISIDF